MEKDVKRELCMEAAGRIHEAWCEGELKAFYGRYTEDMKATPDQHPATALSNACMKNGKKRNEVDIEIYGDYASQAEYKIRTYEGFKQLIRGGYITVKRFTGRELTEEEIKLAGKDYNPETKEENILRPFVELSSASQKENLLAARSAVEVLENLMEYGVTLEELQGDKIPAIVHEIIEEDKPSATLQELIGKLIHNDWMYRNKVNPNNEYLFVPYEQLGEWEKGQDLDVFNAMLEVVKSDPDKYKVEITRTPEDKRVAGVIVKHNPDATALTTIERATAKEDVNNPMHEFGR